MVASRRTRCALVSGARPWGGPSGGHPWERPWSRGTFPWRGPFPWRRVFPRRPALRGGEVANDADVGVGDGIEVVAGLPLDGELLDGGLEELAEGGGNLRLELEELVTVERGGGRARPCSGGSSRRSRRTFLTVSFNSASRWPTISNTGIRGASEFMRVGNE